MPAARTKLISAPIGGLNARDSDVAMPETDALILDNWFPGTTDCKLRGGQANHVTGFAKVVETIIPFSSPTADKLFAATDDGIFDATTAGAVGAAVMALTNGQVQFVQQVTAAGTFLLCVNGADTLKRYNGSAWSSPADITGVTTSDIVNIALHAQRLFFVVKQSMTVHYLAGDAIAGAVASLALGSFFSLGGYIMAAGSWTRDGGAGMDDLFVVITSNGEVAVFSGTDPSDSTNWSLQGVFYLGQPIGRKCFVRLGSELLVLTEAGIFSLSKALASAEKGGLVSATSKIDTIFRTYSKNYASLAGWQMTVVPGETMLLCNAPYSTTQRHQFAQNTVTGAWCRFTEMPIACMGLLAGQLYGGYSTNVVKLLYGHNDFGANIIGRVRAAYTYLGNKNQNKQPSYVRPLFQASRPISIGLNLSVDFDDQLFGSPPANIGGTLGVWDVSTWDAAAWGGTATTNDWLHTPVQPGRCFSLQFQLGSNSGEVRWKATDFLFKQTGPRGMM